MSDSKPLHAEEAIAKLREITGHSPICHFLTRLDQRPIPVRPMRTVQVDDQGAFWFLGSLNTEVTDDVLNNPEVQLLYADPDEAEYLTVFGTATVVHDTKKQDELRSGKGVSPGPAWVLKDRDLCLIKVEPKDSYYRDAKSGKAATILKMMVAGVFGKDGNAAVKGRIITPKG